MKIVSLKNKKQEGVIDVVYTRATRNGLTFVIKHNSNIPFLIGLMHSEYRALLREDVLIIFEYGAFVPSIGKIYMTS